MDSKGRVKFVVLSGDVERDSTAIPAATSASKGADLYIDFSPFEAANATHPQACVAALRNGGQEVLMGCFREDLHLNYAQIMLNNIIIRGNFMYPNAIPDARLCGKWTFGFPKSEHKIIWHGISSGGNRVLRKA